MNEGLANISIVLVETLQGGNIGSTARAMANMGLSRLRLVSPKQYLNTECRRMAGQAVGLVQNAGIFDTFDEAVADQQVVVGTTSTRGRREERRLYMPRDAAPLIREYAQSQCVAVVFGPERGGLNGTQLARCNYVVGIPASPSYPTLNVAQAVLVLCYEIYSREGGDTPRAELAPQEKREEALNHLQEVLIEIGFLSRSNPEHIMDSIRRFLGPSDLTKRDVRIIRGMAQQMRWYVRQGRKMEPESVKKP